MVNRFLKIIRYILIINIINTTNLGVLIIDYIILKFKILKSIINDRGLIFTSSY